MRKRSGGGGVSQGGMTKFGRNSFGRKDLELSKFSQAFAPFLIFFFVKPSKFADGAECLSKT